jgi:hypothetical protein
MKFKPGDKVWVHNPGGECPPGTYAAVVTEVVPVDVSYGDGTDVWWRILCAELLHCGSAMAPESIMTPRDDPPPAKEPKREEVGSWDDCEWRPHPVEVCE